MLAELVAKKLSFSLVLGTYKYKYNEKDFYDSKKDRKKLVKNLPNQFNIKIKNLAKLKKQHLDTIFIDDSVVTGETLKRSLPLLLELSPKVFFAAALKINGKKYLEEKLNQYVFTKYGVEPLLDIISQKGYIYTNQMLRTIKKMPPQDRRSLFRKLPKNKKVLYEEAAVAYFK